MRNIFLFTGEEKFLIDQELEKWKNAFIKKYGKENFFLINEENISDEVLNIIFGGGLLSSKKLIYLFGIPEDTDTTNKLPSKYIKLLQENLEKNISYISPDTVLVLISYKPDKRKSFYKFLTKSSVQVKEFKPLDEKGYIQFIKSILPVLTDEEAKYFLSRVGNNLFRINSELEKFKIYLDTQKVEKKDIKTLIDNLIFSQENIDSFVLLDKILFKDSDYIGYIDKAKGEDIFKFLGLLFWGIKGTLQIISLYKKGYKSSKDIAGKIGLHPFVVSSRLKKIDKLLQREEKIKSLFDKLLDLEIGIKTGKIPSDMFWMQLKRIVL